MRTGLWLFVVVGLLCVFATIRAIFHGWWSDAAEGSLLIAVCWGFTLTLARCIRWRTEDGRSD